MMVNYKLVGGGFNHLETYELLVNGVKIIYPINMTWKMKKLFESTNQYRIVRAQKLQSTVPTT